MNNKLHSKFIFSYTMKLSLFSLNLKGFTDRDMRFSKIIKILKTKNPDIILFQEVCSDQSKE